MMPVFRLVTVAEAREQLSILDTVEDDAIDRKILRASDDIMQYVNMRLDGWTDTNGIPLVDANGDPLRTGGIGALDTNGDFILALDSNGDPIDDGQSVIPGAVQSAALVYIARLDDDREGKDDPFNDTVKALLWNYHQPVFAV